MKIRLLRCGEMRVSETVPFGNAISLANSARQLTEPDKNRVTLPVFCYLIEHPRGLLLVDTGWCREISPRGEYDLSAVKTVLPGRLAAFYHPALPAGEAIHEQLEERGLRPQDLDCVILTHLDPDHVAGLRHLRGAKRIVLPEDEYFWNCRTVYRLRQPQELWIGEPIERLYYRGAADAPNRWAIDLFGDESVLLVNVPGHTDGQAAVLLAQHGKFVLLTADAAFSPRNWRESITPGFGFDREQQLKSLRWIAAKEAEPGCAAVLCSHDPCLPPHTIEI